MDREIYGDDFYRSRRAETLYAAEQVLRLVRGRLDFGSIVDLGCGTGTWLAAALSQGTSQATGVEGGWISHDRLDDSRIELVTQDLEEPVLLDGRRVDLAMSLEVAEHLTPQRAKSFVGDLCSLSDVVLFGAAIPGQGGTNHINEQWQSWWAGLFAERGYLPVDLIRPRIWNDDAVPYWYQQNTLLYVNEAGIEKTGLSPEPVAMLDIVHPRHASRHISAREKLKMVLEIPGQHFRHWRRQRN
ncbi:MAG: class I SAM-dependent methyltransferase [Alphaproteobacteria bacterium]